MKKILATLAMALSATVLSPAPAAESAWVQPKVFMIGDSITYLGSDELRAKRPDWYVWAAGGVRVNQLPAAMDHFLWINKAPTMVVIALGTNASPEWTKESFRTQLNRLPATTKVAFVTTWRDSSKFSSSFAYEGSKEYYQPTYSQWMIELASERPNTCVVPWRGVASQHPEYIYDGVHPNQQGQNAWSSLVANYTVNCI